MSAKITEPPTLAAREWNGFCVWWESDHEYLTGYGGPIESPVGQPPSLTTYVMPHLGKPIKLHFRFTKKAPSTQAHRVTVYLDGVPLHPLFVCPKNCRDISLEHLYSGDRRDTQSATFHVAQMETGAGLDTLPDHVGEIRIEVHRGTITHQRPAGRKSLSVLPKHVASPRLSKPNDPRSLCIVSGRPRPCQARENRGFEVDPSDIDPWITLILKYRSKDELIDKGLILAVKGEYLSPGESGGGPQHTAGAQKAVETRLSRIENALSNVCDQLGLERMSSGTPSPEHQAPPRGYRVKLEPFNDDDEYRATSNTRTGSVVPIEEPVRVAPAAPRIDQRTDPTIIMSDRERLFRQRYPQLYQGGRR